MEVMTDIPKSFWKYYDLFRRNLISIEEYSRLSELSVEEILAYLKRL